MNFTATPLAAAFLVEPVVHADERGAFYRYFCKDEFGRIGHSGEWVQLNHSFTAQRGTVRGMHFQRPPFREIKLVRCIAGKVFDVIVDIRRGSSTFLHHFGAELSAENRKMMYIPEGFAHGFQALTPGCELIYHHSAYYTAGSEGGIRFDDPRVGIRWPLEIGIVSERDRQHPLLTADFTGI
jgi:dTDP-4-dehydrorhamnose 3,5-epimerase